MADKQFGQPKEKFSLTRSGMEADSRVLWSSTNDYIPGMNTGDSQAQAIMSINRNGELLKNIEHSSLNTWRRINAGISYGTNPQRIISNLSNLKAGDDVFWFDMENLGTHKGTKPGQMDWYMPTEIAISHQKVTDKFAMTRGAKGEVSLLIQPTTEAEKKLRDLVSTAKTMMKTRDWTGLSADHRRTLNDLILYGSEDPLGLNGGQKIFQKTNGVTQVLNQNRLAQAPNNFIFTGNHIKAMERGIDNLMAHGNNSNVVAQQLLNMFGGNNNLKLGGFNIQNFDIPMLQSYIGDMLVPNVTDKTTNRSLRRLNRMLGNAEDIDTRQAFNTLYKNQSSLVGKKLTQSDIAQAEGLDVKKAHLGIEDIRLNIELHNKLVESRLGEDGRVVRPGMMDIVNGKVTKGLVAGWDTTPMQQGDRLFSATGMPGFQAGKFDAVYQMNPDGTLEAPYNMKMNPIFTNTEYTLHKEYNGVTLADGNKYFGAMLKNEETGNYHFLARETKEELQNVLQSTMVPAEEALPYAGAGKEQQSLDRARRKYGKMFSDEAGGGRKMMEKMFSALDALEKGREAIKAGTLDAADLGKFIANADGVATQFKDKKTGQVMRYAATPEFMRDFNVMKGRLSAERPYYEDFFKELDRRFPKQNGSYPGSHSVALQQFQRLMEGKFGRNTKVYDRNDLLDVTVGAKNHPVLGGDYNLEKDVKYINLRNKKSIESSIKSIIKSGHTGKPEMSVVKERLHRIVNRARILGSSGLTKGDADAIRGLIKTLKPGDSEYAVVSELAARIDMQYRHSNKMGVNSIELEDPTQMSPERKARLDAGWEDSKKGIMDEAIARTKIYEQKAWMKGGSLHIYDSKLTETLATHNNAMSKLSSQAGFSGTNLIPSIKAEDSLSHLVNSFGKDGYKTALVYDGKSKAMKLVMAHEEIAQKVFRLAPNEILEHAKVASVAIPTLDGKGNIVMPGQQKIAYTKIFHDGQGKAYVGSAFENVIQQLTGRARRAREMMDQGKVMEAESMLKGATRRAVESFSANNQYMSMEGEFDDRKSAGAKYTRSRYVDVANLAEEWYSATFPNKSTSRIKQKMQDSYVTFFQAMNAQEQTQFLHGVSGYANRRYGMNIDMHSVKDVKAMNAVMSTAAGDVRHLIPYGHLNPTARENMPKAVNYMPLDRDESIARLRRKGVSDEKIERMVNRGLVTQEAMTNLVTPDGKEEANWFNLRTAYVESADLSRRINESGVGHARFSTYDGAFVIADDVADAFTFTRTRNIKIGPGGKLTKELDELFQSAVADGTAEVDEKGNIMFKNARQHKLTNYAQRNMVEGSADYGKLKIGDVAKQEVFHGTSHQSIFIQGWNQEKNALQIGEVELLNTGTKMGTDSGHRITATLASREEMKAWGFGDVDAILPEDDPSKAMHGTKVKSQVALVIDQAQEIVHKSNKITAGDVQKSQMMDEAMSTVQRLMNKHLDGEGTLTMKDGRIVMDTNKFLAKGSGITLDGLHAFMSEADVELQKLAANHGQIHNPNLDHEYRRGVEGFARSDVYEWHNSVGRVEGSRDGLVRYGYKEVEAFEKRANRILGEGNAVTGWLRDHIRTASVAQNQDVENYVRGVSRAVLDVTDEDLVHGKVRSGDMVIKTSGNAFSFNDREGAQAVRLNDGVAEVSIHAFNDTPNKTQRGQMFTAKDYARTILDMGGAFDDIIEDTNGKAVNLKEMFEANGGTALLEMPDESFSRKYVRLVDDAVHNIGTSSEGMAVLKELQKSKVQLFRNIKEYQAETNDDTHARVQSAIDDYESKLVKTVSSARDGSIQSLRSAKLDMSGRFNIQSINPLVDAGKGHYEEGTIYVGEKRAGDMIRGAEKNIAEAVGLDISGLSNTEVRSKVLEHMSENGLYGLTNRYPTIAEDTGQILKFKIDKSLDEEAKRLHGNSAHFKSGYMTVGTAMRMNADYDGDFFSTVLAHYKSEKGVDGARFDAKDIHNAMSDIFNGYTDAEGNVVRGDKERLEAYAQSVMEDLQEDARKKNITVGKLWQDEEYRNKFIRDNSGDVQFGLKTGELYDKETQVARLGKGNVGPLDNDRQKIRNIASETYGILADQGLIPRSMADQKVDILEQFGRAVSQKSISSKKFSVETLTRSIMSEQGFEPAQIDEEVARRMDTMDEAVQKLRQGIRMPTAEGRGLIQEANNVLGFISDSSDDYTLAKSLDTLGELHKLTGSNRYLSNSYQLFGMSEGKDDIERMSREMRGQSGDQMILSPGAEMVSETSDTFHTAAEEGRQRYAKNVVSNFHNMNQNSETLMRAIDDTAIQATEHVLDGATSAERASISLRGIASRMGGPADFGSGTKGAAFGAAAFGAMWATSALMRSGPTPEAMKEQAPPPASAQPKMQGPTARITPGASGEKINISVDAKSAKGMSEQDIAALVHQEISGMTSMNMNVNMNVNDNTQNIDRQWLNQVVANAVDKGYGF